MSEGWSALDEEVCGEAHLAGPTLRLRVYSSGNLYPSPARSALLVHFFHVFMTECVKPLRHLERLSAMSSRSTNQNAEFGQLSATCC